jgi:hypothetical protein
VTTRPIPELGLPAGAVTYYDVEIVCGITDSTTTRPPGVPREDVQRR